MDDCIGANLGAWAGLSASARLEHASYGETRQAQSAKAVDHGSEAALKSGPTSGLLFAQAPAQGTPPPQIKGQTSVLGRPDCARSDPVPIFDFDAYFLGRWAFEIDVPDTDLGPGGTIKGTTTYRAVPNGTFDGGAFYEADTEATGPSGPLKIREVIGYEIAHKAMSRQVTDSRGFSYLQIGPIGADLGGYFNLHFAGTPFTYKGKTSQAGSQPAPALAGAAPGQSYHYGQWHDDAVRHRLVEEAIWPRSEPRQKRRR